MSAATSEGRSRPRWFIRGIGINNPSTNGISPVAVYFDEVYQNFTLAQSFPFSTSSGSRYCVAPRAPCGVRTPPAAR